MNDGKNLNDHGNHQGEFTQGVGGWAEYTVHMTETTDTVRHDVTLPPGKVIPVIFLPGVMGSNLRMSKVRQEQLKRPDNRAWRPDDMVTKSGKLDVALGTGLGGWFKNATPRQRQLDFDPNETEVEYYHYTEEKGRFDPQGKETLSADALHQNVPDSLDAIPPLLGARPRLTESANQRKTETPAQIARWRGWSEVLFDGAYGEMLKTAELFLNNIVTKGKISPFWQSMPTDPETGKPLLSVPGRALTHLLMQDPRAYGATSGAAISDVDLKKMAPCWYPVHAMGYNFLRSNGESAKVIAKRISGMVKGYQQRGFKCSEVIIVTHSMGGLLARALIHPSYGNLLANSSVKVLGIYHNVMPTIGAAGAYKRMRFGFQEKDGCVAKLEARVLGIDGQHATAILANAPAPLEMMPGAAYGKDWLKVVDGANRTLWSWPRGEGTALDSIYLKPDQAWWRLINPKWVNPGNVAAEKGGGVKEVYRRLERAAEFLQSIENTFHSKTYASYCASSERLSYGEVVFKTFDPAGGKVFDGRAVPLPPAESWILLTDDKKGRLTVQAGQRVLDLRLQPANAPGDETVPSSRSAKHIVGNHFVHEKDKGYEHQDSYADPQVLASMMYSIVQIAKSAKWD
jgi:hypothetical protein